MPIPSERFAGRGRQNAGALCQSVTVGVTAQKSLAALLAQSFAGVMLT
jgi:hypothetical protein